MHLEEPRPVGNVKSAEEEGITPTTISLWNPIVLLPSSTLLSPCGFNIAYNQRHYY